MIFNCFSLPLVAEIRSIEGVGGEASVRYKEDIFYRYKEVRYMRVLLYNIHSEKSLFNLKNSFFVCIVCIAMGSKKNVLLIQTNCLVDVLF